MAAIADAASGRRHPPLLATVLAAIGAGMVVGAWVVFARMPGGPRDGSELAFTLVGAVTIAIGLVTSWRVRDNVVGPLVVAFGVVETYLVAARPGTGVPPSSPKCSRSRRRSFAR